MLIERSCGGMEDTKFQNKKGIETTKKSLIEYGSEANIKHRYMRGISRRQTPSPHRIQDRSWMNPKSINQIEKLLELYHGFAPFAVRPDSGQL